MMQDKDFAPRSDERGANGGLLSPHRTEDRNEMGFEPERFAEAGVGALVAGNHGGEGFQRGALPAEKAAKGDGSGDLSQRGAKVKAALRARLGEDVFSSWFTTLEFQSFDGQLLKVSVPVKFLRNWIQSHYADALIACAASEFPGVGQVEVLLRQPSAAPGKVQGTQPLRKSSNGMEPPRSFAEPATTERTAGDMPGHAAPRLQVNGLEGSPLDPRYTFESFVVGPANRMAHAGAVQVACHARGLDFGG